MTGHKEIKNEIIKTAIMGGVDKATTCQYKGGANKYCKITTNEKCGKCRFYEPSFEATLELGYEMICRGRRCVDAAFDATWNISNATNQMRKAGLNILPDRIDSAIDSIITANK